MLPGAEFETFAYPGRPDGISGDLKLYILDCTRCRLAKFNSYSGKRLYFNYLIVDSLQLPRHYDNAITKNVSKYL